MTLVLENAAFLLGLEMRTAKQAAFYIFSRLLERPFGVNT